MARGQSRRQGPRGEPVPTWQQPSRYRKQLTASVRELARCGELAQQCREMAPLRDKKSQLKPFDRIIAGPEISHTLGPLPTQCVKGHTRKLQPIVSVPFVNAVQRCL